MTRWFNATILEAWRQGKGGGLRFEGRQSRFGNVFVKIVKVVLKVIHMLMGTDNTTG